MAIFMMNFERYDEFPKDKITPEIKRSKRHTEATGITTEEAKN